MQEVSNAVSNAILETINETNNKNANIPMKPANPPKKLESPNPYSQKSFSKASHDSYLYSESLKPQKKVKDSMDEFDDIIRDLEAKSTLNEDNSTKNPKNNSNNKGFSRNRDDALMTDIFGSSIKQASNDFRNMNSGKKTYIPSANNMQEIDEYISAKKANKDPIKSELATQKKKFDNFFQSSTNDNSYKDNRNNDDIFEDDFLKNVETKPNKFKTNFDNSLLQEADGRKKSATLKKQSIPNKNKYVNDDLLEELFGDDLFGGNKNRTQSPIMSHMKPKSIQKTNKNNYEELFNETFDEPVLNARDRNSPWNQEKQFQTRRSRYVPGLNSGKKDNINSKPNSGKWNQPFQNAANSAVKTGIEAQKSSYVPSFMGSGNDSARKGKTIICLNVLKIRLSQFDSNSLHFHYHYLNLCIISRL